jgi:hypothetical protein
LSPSSSSFAQLARIGESGLGACYYSIVASGNIGQAALAFVRSMIEKYPLVKAAEGYARMMSGKAD